MGKMLSPANTIKAIGVLLAMGVACMLSTWWIWAYTFLALAGFWLILYILYRKQVIDISIHSCAIENAKRDGDFDLVVYAEVKARHKDYIKDIYLSLLDKSYVPVDTPIHEIIDTYKTFVVRYKLAMCYMRDGRDFQNCEKPLDIGQLCIETTQKRYSASDAFNFSLAPPNCDNWLLPYHDDNWLMNIKNKLNGNTNKVKGTGISKIEFHKILDKVSQPNKKRRS